MKKLLFNLTLLAGLALSASCSALTLEQPEYLGSIEWNYRGPGYVIKQAVDNTGSAFTVDRGVAIYKEGIATFGKGGKAIKVKYSPAIGYVSQNVVLSPNGKNISLLANGISHVSTDQELELYILWSSEASESTFQILGKRLDGAIVEYLNNSKLYDRYLKGKPGVIWYEKPVVVDNKIVISYGTSLTKSTYVKGKTTLTWDEKAQWFAIDNVILDEGDVRYGKR